MAKIKVKEVRHHRLYIHNDLMNVSFHLKEHVQKINANGEHGITLHIISALTMLAFTYEAQINFIGHKKVKIWKERESFKKKSSKIFQELNLTPNHNERPYSSIQKLKQFRDFIAHGKPVEKDIEVEKIVDQDDEFDLGLKSDHEELCTLENLEEIYIDVNAVWEELLEVAGIEVFETITRNSGGRTYIEHVAN